MAGGAAPFDLSPGDPAKESKELDEVLNRVVQFIETSTTTSALPLYIDGTVFQKRPENVKRDSVRSDWTYKELASSWE